MADATERPVRMSAALTGAYWTQQRSELVDWLEDRAPSFVEGYVGAVELLHTLTFPARVHFVCHAVRDIYRRLPTSLGAKALPRPAEVFPNMVREFAKHWERSPLNPVGSAGQTGSGFLVSAQVYRYAERIVGKSADIKNQPTVGKQLAIALFRSLDRDDDEFIHPWIIESFDAEYDFFVKRAHLPESVEKVPDDDGLTEHFEAFERALHSLVGPYFSGKEELDAILQDTNEAAD